LSQSVARASYSSLANLEPDGHSYRSAAFLAPKLIGTQQKPKSPLHSKNIFSPGSTLYLLSAQEYCDREMNDTEEQLEQWFAREVLAHERSLVRYLTRVWPNRDEVPDLRQDVYMRVFECAQKARPEQPKAFLFTTARHLMTDRLRRSRIIFIGTRGDLDELNVLVDELSPEYRMTSIQELQQLALAFDGLPRQCRAVMWLRKVEQLSQKEVAARLGVHEKAVEKQVARGMRLLTAAVLAGIDVTGLHDELDQSTNEFEHG
jgi:RNA polymerase sigma factor (sigma-70 family)